jgi:16S rRNA (guanine527-N7)-methyltransferase
MIDVSRETKALLDRYVALLLEENQRQNLIARSTVEEIWDRHIVDSAQLVRFAPRPDSSWLDIGSGAGLPGLVIAILAEGPVTLLEPRKLRAEFLHQAADALGLANRVTVHAAKVERITGRFDVITARAVAPLDALLRISQHLSTDKTTWVLPKGKSAQTELDEARRAWQGSFRLEPSVTSGEAAILVAAGVRRSGMIRIGRQPEGRSGETPTAINLATALPPSAEGAAGRLRPQGNASTGWRWPVEPHSVLTKHGLVGPVTEVAMPTWVPRLKPLPATVDLSGAGDRAGRPRETDAPP